MLSRFYPNKVAAYRYPSESVVNVSHGKTAAARAGYSGKVEGEADETCDHAGAEEMHGLRPADLPEVDVGQLGELGVAYYALVLSLGRAVALVLVELVVCLE